MDANSPQIYEFGAFRLDLTERLLTQKGKPIPLTPKAFEVLAYLVEQHGHLVEKNELMNEVWCDSIVEEANLSRTIWMLRQALGDDRNGHGIIETVPKHGYRFVAEIKVVETAPQVSETLDGAAADTKRESDGVFRVGGEGAAFAEKTVSSDLPEGVTAASLPKTEASSSGVESNMTVTASGRHRLPIALAVALILVFALALIFMLRSGDVSAAPIRSIAVIPLENLSGDPTQDSFADAISEVLNTELGKIRQLRVVERAATSRYRTTQKGVSEIAHELNVGAVARGAAMRVGDRIRITIQLYRGSDGQNLWSQIYDRPYDDVLDLQSSIAKRIASEIRLNLSAADEAVLANSGLTDPKARDAFLQGVEYFTVAQNMPNLNRRPEMFLRAVEPFQQAISIEPDYINAHEKLMSTYYYLAGGSLEDPNAEYWQKTVDEAKVLLKLDPENSKAHTHLATYAWRYKWDRAEAEREFSLAFKDRPDSAGSHLYALFLSSDGLQDEAIEAMKRAIETNPSSDGMKMNMANFYTRKHDYDGAIEYLKQLIELNPQSPRLRNPLSRAYACKGMYREAVRVAEKDVEIGDNVGGKIHLAWIYARSGSHDSAVKTMKEVLANSPPGAGSRGAFDTAGVYAELGEKDKAFDWLERAYAARGFSLIWLKVEPEMDKLQGDPRYDDLLRRIGLSP